MTSTGETVYKLSLCPDEYVWDHPRVGTFEIARDGSKIRWWARDETSQDIATMLCGPILGFALQLQGVAGLHGTAVARSGEALGLLAPSGYGKSTLAAALLRRGFELLTDDVLVAEITDQSVAALPSRPQLKLWPGSLEHLVPDWQGLSVYMSWLDKRVYVPERVATPKEAFNLRALYALAPAGESDEVSIERLRGSSAFITLLGLGYQASQLAREAALLKTRMDHSQRLAERVPIYRLGYPRIFERLDEVANAVVMHTAEVVGRGN
jgi:hypothetical protein